MVVSSMPPDDPRRLAMSRTSTGDGLKRIDEPRGGAIRNWMSTGPGWSLYRSLLAVMEEGSLSGAARRLGLTQPTLARHIDALEQAVGAELFLRTPRGLLPTELALELRPYAETLESTAAALLRTASGRAEEVRGIVRISASEVVGVEHLPPILAQLRRRHPALIVELMLSDTTSNLLQR